MSNDTVLWQEWEGLIVPKEFSIGYVVLSYVVSYVGTWTTLELLNKRTAGRGLYNWYVQLRGSASLIANFGLTGPSSLVHPSPWEASPFGVCTISATERQSSVVGSLCFRSHTTPVLPPCPSSFQF